VEADLSLANVSRAVLSGATLSGAKLIRANLRESVFGGTNLSRANLSYAHLSGAHVTYANLSGADLSYADLTVALLEAADLSGADLDGANLSGAKLIRAHPDLETNLSNVILSDTTERLPSLLAAFIRRQRLYGPVSLADVRWNGVDLTGVDWSGLRKLGDEHSKRWWWRSRNESERAVRANIQVAKQLDNAGLKDDADRFFYRAQVRQRGVHLLRFRLLRWLFSWVLFVIAGYGYRPLRSIVTYLLVVAGFAALYLGLGGAGGHALSWNEALVVSLTAFHGRGFFATAFQPGDPQAALAAVEAVIGLLIEITFIATFTQRFFAR
jgi:uncharacterized protein YjbI with pentapeptide repeats